MISKGAEMISKGAEMISKGAEMISKGAEMISEDAELNRQACASISDGRARIEKAPQMPCRRISSM
jgi:hypothetical protein